MLIAPLLALSMALSPAEDVKSIDVVLGKGAVANKGDVVTVNYRGNLLDGTVFDATKGKPPFAFVLGKGEVIKGWDQGVLGMKVGGRRVLSIPPDLGYGDQATGPIPAKSTLIFEVELLRVDRQGAQPMIEIEEISAGSGDEAKPGDTLEVHYTGTFVNGEKFDSSRDRNQTFKVVLGKTGIIKGFELGLTGMKEGGRRKVTIPYALAYGEEGRPPVIPPRSTLVFDLEVVKITKG